METVDGSLAAEISSPGSLRGTIPEHLSTLKLSPFYTHLCDILKVHIHLLAEIGVKSGVAVFLREE